MKQMIEIVDVLGREILDSRGNPTVEVEVYLDDGTMIVVENGRRHVGEQVAVVVTTVLQTSAGRMIFSKLKSEAEGSAEAAAKRAM